MTATDSAWYSTKVCPADSNPTDSPIWTEERFRLLVESVTEYAIYLLDTQGNVSSWNEGAARLKGYTADEIVGQHFSKFYRPEDVAAGLCEANLTRALREGRAEDHGWRIRKDGSQFWADVVITCVRDASGRHVGFAKVTRDLTERAYRTFVEATNAIVWTTDGQGRPNSDSASWRAFTGQTEEDWRSLRGWEPVHPDDQPVLRVLWPEAKAAKKTFEAEFRLRRHDGVYVWMAVRALPFLGRDGDVREWFGVTFDISARKDAEARARDALEREREARLDAERARSLWTTTLESIGDAVIATDTEGRVTFLNAVAEGLTGWNLEAARQRPLADVFRIFHEETRDPVENPVDKVLREGAVVGLANHTVLVRRDGVDIPIDDSAAPIRDKSGALFGVVMVFRDVTERKLEETRRQLLNQASAALAMSTDYEEALKAIAELAVPRLADWCAVDILKAGEQATVRLAVAHVDPEKVTFARELERRYPPDPNAQTGVPNVIRTGRAELYPDIPPELLEAGAVDEEHLQILRDLRLRSALVVPLRGRERVLGAVTFVYGESGRSYTERDLAFAEELAHRAGVVIERRKLEDERVLLLERERHAREQADLANRAKDEFLATVSHELRNPLNAILGWAKLLLQRDLPPELRTPLTTIERNARVQARLIEDILDIARIISGKLHLEIGDATLAQAVADALESVRPLASAKDITLECHVEPNIELKADQLRLQQIVANLLSNAVKFTPREGQVRLQAERAGSHVRIRVRDTGVGIAPELLSVIFEPFRQADASTTRRQGGLGLGLAIVRQLVVAHGGSVRAESAGLGLGATFIVELPLKPNLSAGPASDRSHAAPGLVRLRGTRVLVVDDEPDALGLMREILTNAGAVVEVASSALDAVAKISAFRPDVLVSDIGMPDVDGLGLIRRVRALDAAAGGRTPAVALTAYARREDAERSFAAGFQTHLSKPVDAAELTLTIANLAGLALDG